MPLPDPGGGPLDPSRVERLKHRQLESLARQAARVPIPVLLASGFVAAVVWDSVPKNLVLGWMAAITVVLIARWWYSQWAVAKLGAEVDRALRVVTTLSFFNGLVTGAGALLFFPMLELDRQAVLTMIFVCNAAGAVAANASYPKAFYAYSIPLIGALAMAWSLDAEPGGLWNAMLLVLLAVIQAVFVRENERVLRESYEIRYKNERLLHQLDLERQAVLREKDRAEEANLAKSRFLAAASHDLRQPLHAVSLFSASLALQKTDPRSQELGREIGNAVQSLGSLLDALLDISKLDADAVRPEPSRFALDKFLGRIAADLRPLALEKGLSLDLGTNEHLPVETDVVLLERIVRNLADNALKYTMRGGLRLEARRSGGRAVLIVTDTGQGIPREEQEHVFEEFYQLSNPERDRSRGIGLGLAIVRRLTNLLGIEMTMSSEVNRGTQFVLSLPLAMPQAADSESPPAAASEEVALPQARVLVVDDEASVREGMRSLLETWGLAVTVAGGIDEALQKLNGSTPDLIIADHRLRGRETGIELLRRARTLTGAVRALLITGDTAAQLQDEAQALAVGLLHKPVSELALRRAIARVLR